MQQVKPDSQACQFENLGNLPVHGKVPQLDGLFLRPLEEQAFTQCPNPEILRIDQLVEYRWLVAVNRDRGAAIAGTGNRAPGTWIGTEAG